MTARRKPSASNSDPSPLARPVTLSIDRGGSTIRRHQGGPCSDWTMSRCGGQTTGNSARRSDALGKGQRYAFWSGALAALRHSHHLFVPVAVAVLVEIESAPIDRVEAAL